MPKSKWWLSRTPGVSRDAEKGIRCFQSRTNFRTLTAIEIEACKSGSRLPSVPP